MPLGWVKRWSQHRTYMPKRSWRMAVDRLVHFGDAPEIANTLIALIENEAERHRMRKLAYTYGQQTIWSEVAKGYRTLFERVAATYRQQALTRPVRKLTPANYKLPEITLDHLHRLTDDPGIMQHVTY